MTEYVIIEDEKPAARRLQRMLEMEGISHTVLLHSVAESVKWLQNNPRPRLIFADIHLSDGTFFDLSRRHQIESPIIFTTAFDQYAIKAFKLNSIDYLLKPIRQDELHTALQKHKNQMVKYSPDWINVFQNLSLEKSYKQRFTVQYGPYLQSIPAADISCFFSQDKTSYLVTKEGESFIYDESLEQIESQLNPDIFMRVNRKFIIAYPAIKKIVAYSNSRYKILLKNFSGSDIIVARERAKKFKEWISK